MSEKIIIANMALSWLGEEEITSLEDDLDRARIMKTNYIPARDATLEAHEWSFAIRRFVPAKLEETPPYGVAYAFHVPSDILRVISVDPNQQDDSKPWRQPINSAEQLDWVIEGGNILCNEDAIYCRGIRRVEDEGSFSPLFDHALAAKLASLTAVAITASAEIQANMFGLYDNFIREAKSRDGLQGRSKRIRARTLLKVR